jgi:ADP-heptose:LPS heptosyltransferase
MATVLVIRLSSLGDVAILIPVLYSVAEKYPDERFLVLTQHPWQSLFVNKPSNLTVFPVYKREKHKGIRGIVRLLYELAPLIHTNDVKLADVHDVIRSFLIRSYFRLRGARIAVIEKGRGDKRRLVRPNYKILHPLKATQERYRQVFENLGYDASLSFTGLFSEKPTKERVWVGIAPFAKHSGKTYPLEQMEKVISRLSERQEMQLFLFGGKEESGLLESWSAQYKWVESVAGQLSFQEELLLMNQLDLMVSMDSANMHLASLVNTPVVSIWGATHPYAGFYGFNQDTKNAVQIDLPCRPCSVFGNKSCRRGDYACLNQISPEEIVRKIEQVLCLPAASRSASAGASSAPGSAETSAAGAASATASSG